MFETKAMSKGAIVRQRPVYAGVAGLVVAAMTGLFAAQAHAEVQSGQKFDNWTVNCEGDGANRLCHIDQNVVAKENNRSVLQVGVGFMPDSKGGKAPKMIIMVPLGVVLPAGIGLQVDETQAARMPYIQCFPAGCRTVINLEDEGLKKLRNGKVAKFTYELPNGQPITVPVQLGGFGKGFDSISK